MNNMTPKLLATALLACACSALPVMAEESGVSVSGNVALVSDYRFRDWSQTNTEAAVQGGFDVDFGNGFSAGVWGSSIDFGGVGDSMELDLYAGYGNSFGEGDNEVSYDLGYVYYGYPGADEVVISATNKPDYDYQEVYANIGYRGFSAGIAYSDDYWLESGEFIYFSAGYEHELPAGFNLALHYGYNDFAVAGDDSNSEEAARAFLGDNQSSYSDWSIGISKEVFTLNADLTWVETDVSDDACFNTDNCDGSLVFSLSKEF